MSKPIGGRGKRVEKVQGEALFKGAENYHINLIIMIFTAVNNYNYAKLLNNYCLLAINRNIMSFATLVNCSLVVVVVVFSSVIVAGAISVE